MTLCFGTLVKILLKYTRSGVTQIEFVNSFMKAVDPEFCFPLSNRSSLTRILHRKANLSAKMQTALLRHKSGENSTNMIVRNIAEKIRETTTPLLDVDNEVNAVVALRYLINSDPSIRDKNKLEFETDKILAH